MASDLFQLCNKILSHGYLILLTILLFFFTHNSVDCISTQELDSMLAIVRVRGYNLFSNAIATSDLELDLLTSSTNSSFTFFAPTDSSLFALAMTQSVSSYTATLRYHGVPQRLSISELRRLPSRSNIPTLLQSNYVFVTRRRRGSRSDDISVNGVSIVRPGLYYSGRVVVHGLGGILSRHTQINGAYGFPPIPLLHMHNRTFTVPDFGHSIGISPVPAPNAISANTPTRSRTNEINPPDQQNPIPSPLESPDTISDYHLTPSINPPENEASASVPAPVNPPPRMKVEDNMAANTAEKFDSLEWMTFEFSKGNPNSHLDIEDSHPHIIHSAG